MVWHDANQIRLTRYRRAVFLDDLVRIDHITAAFHQVNRSKIVRNVPKASSHILLYNIKLAGNVLGVFSDIELPVNHQHTHQCRGKEVGHIVINGSKLRHL